MASRDDRHRALDKLRGDLPEAETSGAVGAEAAAMQDALAGFKNVDVPRLRDAGGFRPWRSRIHMRDVFDVVEQFFSHDPVREACRAAVGRLPRAERDAIDGFFYKELTVPQLAERRAVAASTIYNQKARAQSRLGGTTSSSLCSTSSTACATRPGSGNSRRGSPTAGCRTAAGAS